MTDEQKARAAELKARMAAHGTPTELREAVVALKNDGVRGGSTVREVAEAVGLRVGTLYRWQRQGRSGQRGEGVAVRATDADGAAAFRRVRLKAPGTSRSVALAAVAASGGLRVAHAPSGLVIDGLDVNTLAALLRRMS